MLAEYLESLKLLDSEAEYYNIDFKSGRELKKCTIESAGQRLLVTDGAKVKYIVELDSIEKISAFSIISNKKGRLSLPQFLFCFISCSSIRSILFSILSIPSVRVFIFSFLNFSANNLSFSQSVLSTFFSKSERIYL